MPVLFGSAVRPTGRRGPGIGARRRGRTRCRAGLRTLAVGGAAVMALLGGTPMPALAGSGADGGTPMPASPGSQPAGTAGTGTATTGTAGTAAVGPAGTATADTAATGTAAIAAAGSAATRTAGAAGVAPVAWSPCGGGFDCGTVTVPVDHRNPGGATLDLAVIRWKAADPATRIGSLFLNPGGPGGSGLSFLRGAPPIALQIASRRFDVVSWDPRGVGASAQLTCGETDLPEGLPRPGRFDPQEWVRASRDFGRACARANPDLRFFSTADTARDLDLLRQAVGDEKLSYLGISYGTLIGSTYASLFPGRSRALVLDAAIDPEVYLHRPLEARQEQVSAFERGLHRFFTACAGDQVACSGFGGSDPETAFDALVAKADANPIPTTNGTRPLTGDDILDAADEIVYSKFSWRFFARALKAAQDGDGGLVQLLNQPSAGFSGEASVLIRALDQGYPRQPRPILEEGRFSGRAFPHFGWLSGALELPFGLLPVAAERPFTGPFRNPAGAAPVLVVGTTYDTATPYVWAQRLTAQLGNARLLTYQGDGHAATTDLNPCATAAMFGYLETGVLPAEGTVCVQVDPFRSSGTAARTASVPDGWDWEIEARLH